MIVAASKTGKMPHPSVLSPPQWKSTELERHVEGFLAAVPAQCLYPPTLQMVVSLRHKKKISFQ